MNGHSNGMGGVSDSCACPAHAEGQVAVPTTALPVGCRVRTTKAWADKHHQGHALTGVAVDVATVGRHPLHTDRTHRVRLDAAPWWAPDLPYLTFNPADLEPTGEQPAALRSPQQVIADTLNDLPIAYAAPYEDRAATRAVWAQDVLVALAECGYAVVSVDEPDDQEEPR